MPISIGPWLRECNSDGERWQRSFGLQDRGEMNRAIGWTQWQWLGLSGINWQGGIRATEIQSLTGIESFSRSRSTSLATSQQEIAQIPNPSADCASMKLRYSGGSWVFPATHQIQMWVSRMITLERSNPIQVTGQLDCEKRERYLRVSFLEFSAQGPKKQQLQLFALL